MIESGEVEQSKISKSVLVIDEAQDMTEEEYRLIQTLIEHNPEMRVIAVGDDDQNIYEFRHASSEHFKNLLNFGDKSTSYSLLTNYRSVMKIVNFSNMFATNIKHRMKDKPSVYIRKDAGSVSIIEFEQTNLEIPVVSHLKSVYKKEERTAILTQTNLEAFKVMGLLKGFRGEAPGDIDAVKSAIVRVARLTLDFPEISELDINPIFVYEKGSSALDVKIKIDEE